MENGELLLAVTQKLSLLGEWHVLHFTHLLLTVHVESTVSG